MTPTIDIHSDLLPDELEFERMKLELFTRLDEPVHVAPRRHRSTKRRAFAASGLVAAAIVATLVVANVASPRGASAEAAEVLHSAAFASIHANDPFVGPGQYLKIETTEAALEFSDHAAYVSSQRVILWVPADRRDNWVQSRQQLPPGKQYGDASDSIREDFTGPRADGHKPGDVVLHQSAAGRFISYPLPFAELAALPDNPDALHDYLYSHVSGDQSKDQEVYGEIRQLLIYGLVPAKVRGAMYEVLAEIPGVYLSAGRANLAGRTGVGISLLDSSGNYIQQLIIDPMTGLMIGTRDLGINAAGTVPAGVSQDWTAVTTSVVDSAPTGPFLTELAPG